MAPRTPGSLASRARRVVAFVAIVWGVAATFVAFEVVSLSAVDLALSYPALFGDLMLSRTVTESTSCTVPTGDKPRLPAPGVSEADVRVESWLLGLSLGRDALFRQYAPSNRQVPEQLAAERHDLAARLSVPPPEAFIPEQLANANTEFVAFVEQGGAAHTARRLAAAYSPHACELFKIGALWGYSEMIRPALPGERAVFGMEIRHHATRAGIPEPLWSPMLRRTPAGAKADDIVAEMEKLTGDVTTYLAGQR
jgi:hypothetical protein